MIVDLIRGGMYRAGPVGSIALEFVKALLQRSFALGTKCRLIPPEIEVRRRGVSYRLDVRDDIQQLILLNVYEAAEIDALSRFARPGSTCIDVGANVGFFACNLAKIVGAEGRVFAFEPDADNVRRLRANVRLNAYERIVDVSEVALGSTTGTSTFYKSSASRSGWGSLVKYPDLDTDERSVRTETLDAFCESRSIREIDLIKIDIEGFEFEFLAGATETFAAGRIRAVVIEFNGPRMTERGRTLDEMIAYFTVRGYDLRDADRIATLGSVRATREVFNLIFVTSRRPS